MKIYSHDRMSKLYYPPMSASPVSTEIQVTEVGMCKTWKRVEFFVNGIKFVNLQVVSNSTEYDKLIKRLKECSDEIEAVVRNMQSADKPYIKTDTVFLFDEFGNYTTK